MGTYNTTFIGIYLEIPYYKEIKTTIKYTHPKTGNKMSNRFCQETGVEGIKNETKTEVYVRPYAYIDDNEDLDENIFFTPEYTGGGKNIATFIFNDGEDKKFYYSDDDLFNFQLTDLSPIELIEEFKIKYSKYLEYYSNKFGDFDIKFGVVNYAH